MNIANERVSEKKQREVSKQTKLSKHGTYISKESLALSQDVVEDLPQLVKDYLKYASPLSDGPDEFLLSPFLAICGAVIGKKRFVKLGSQKVYPTIWTVLFAGSSQFRKSTALNISKDPFRLTADSWNEEKKGTSKPVLRSLYAPDGFSDLTFWESLRDYQSMISMPSEFTALWNEITDSKLSEISLSLFDAEDRVQRKTKSGGDILLKNPVWCIAGATTVHNFQQTLTATERSSGLLQRILPVYVHERTKSFKAPTEIPTADEELLQKISITLLNLSSSQWKEVGITKEANVAITEWSHDLHDRSQQLSEKISDIGSYISRLNMYALKFALIFQQLDDPNEDITLKNAQASMKLCDWFLRHIIYMLSENYIFNRYYGDRKKIRNIISKQPGKRISKTLLMNTSHFDKTVLERALESEIEAGIIRKITIKTAGRPKNVYKLVGDV